MTEYIILISEYTEHKELRNKDSMPYWRDYEYIDYRSEPLDANVWGIGDTITDKFLNYMKNIKSEINIAQFVYKKKTNEKLKYSFSRNYRLYERNMYDDVYIQLIANVKIEIFVTRSDYFKKIEQIQKIDGVFFLDGDASGCKTYRAIDKVNYMGHKNIESLVDTMESDIYYPVL